MAASAPKAEAVESDTEPIESLPFVKLRLPLLRDGLTDVIDQKRKQDRTTSLVVKWKILRETLPQARAQTVSCCEAIEGKSGAVTLKVFDRPKLDQIQKAIESLTADLESAEAAIRELNGFAATDYLVDLHDTLTSLGGVEAHSRAVMSNEAAVAIHRGQKRGHSVEEALAKDEIYLNRKHIIEGQLDTCRKTHASVLEKSQKIEAILDRVCA